MADLAEEHRQRLDSIVQKMEAAGESPENIRNVIGDFKLKYTQGSAPIPQEAGIRPQTASDTFRENIGRHLTAALPMILGGAGAAIPGAGPAAGPLGTL